MPVIPKEELLKILRDVKARLQEILGENLVEIILFGSYARGEAEEWSDVDVLVVVKRWPTLEELDRMAEATNKYAIEKGVAISLIPYIEKPDMSSDPLILNVMREGIKV
ncbi:nucleotidyltransferase [Thermococcus kodakarensis KOD1]|uniref:Nucleotidyltransferase n=1 Tax=Thermococcus kodakarensis (strain ATCC BAA-918 / JCM 12380 / KOD1) TaxID=69014 RepID=Q5JII6_THEKO|nr:nucleotidyltransferase domain-containing protein [Thermococcus kodakarensis]WCN27870.1 nucleotidyltransferase domain-containing protein [Thermococcus kodakarensis]WCN30168.1 nucleotidyltransferase domain-containing protein [Thermococcus kodakarensis]BAD86183.1 nucleotidyltransferase [Thermococcus kodakarensis KOD1]